MNILFVHTDQQRRDSLRCYGNSEGRTPTFDRLAAEGIVFDNAFTPVPLCGPARASLLTGLRPIHHGILFNVESGCVAGRDFAGRPEGFGQRLRDRGYYCAHVGKWHIGTELTPADCGFEGLYYAGYGYPEAHPHYLEYLRRLGLPGFVLREQRHSDGLPGRKGFLLTAVQEGGVEASVPYYLAEQAIAAMRFAVEAGREFFVAVDFWGPHAPYILPEQYARMHHPAAVTPPATSSEDLAGKPRLQQDYARYWGVDGFDSSRWAELVAACYGYISLIDAQVGRLLACLEDVGVAGETAVIFTTDHGGMVGSHGLMDKGPFLYDPVCRVPLIVRLPGGRGGGTHDEHIVYNMDLMPTFLELAGANVPERLDAASLLPLCTGRNGGFPERRAAFSEYHGHQVPAFGRMVRTERHKYVFNGCGLDELYDLRSDPLERRNLIGDPAARQPLAELRAMLAEHLRRQQDPVLRFYLGTRMEGDGPEPLRGPSWRPQRKAEPE